MMLSLQCLPDLRDLPDLSRRLRPSDLPDLRALPDQRDLPGRSRLSDLLDPPGLPDRCYSN
jgi:hypothetical protein